MPALVKISTISLFLVSLVVSSCTTKPVSKPDQSKPEVLAVGAEAQGDGENLVTIVPVKATEPGKLMDANLSTLADIAYPEVLVEPTQSPQAVKLINPTGHDKPTKTIKETKPATSQAIPLLVSLKSSQGASLTVGGSLQLSVEAGHDSQVHCYYQDGSGTIARLFPNRYMSDGMLRAGEILVIPSTDEWEITTTSAGAIEEFMCIGVVPELADRLNNLSKQPDLKPLAATDLNEIYTRYKNAVGAELIRHSIRVAVN